MTQKNGGLVTAPRFLLLDPLAKKERPDAML